MSIYNISQFIYLSQNMEDLQEASTTLYNFFSTVSVMMKMSIFDAKIRTIKHIIDTLQIEQFQPRNEEETKILKRAMFISKFLTFYFLSTCCVVMFMWIFSPLMDHTRKLPSNAWFPFDYRAPEYYGLTYLCQGIVIIYFGTTNISLDTTFAAILVQIGGQCDVLNQRISNIGKNWKNTDELKEYFRDCINHHKIILE